uniref:L,D-transpeptidase n=1 Tax=Paenibacillus koleovorans TaxID=121608 RepID=UPI0013E2FDA3
AALDVIGGAASALLVRPTVLAPGGWIDWQAKPRQLYSLDKAPEAAGAYKLQAYDKDTCVCEPGDPTAAAAQYSGWQAAAEQKLVAQSAIQGYTTRNGQPPATPEAITASYPNNSLPGLTPGLKELIASMLANPSPPPGAPPQAGAPANGQLPNPGNQPQQAGPPLSQAIALDDTLRIVIDKTAHRLALVSGSVLLRSYPVGLGGNRTPEGEFTISEKVRNPNGRDNGDFGSRGMTLSDTLYAIHGTNQPTSIGADRSLGCIRMLKGDVEELFDMVPLGTKVTIGKGLLPADIRRAEVPFRLPVQAQETNPGKVYKWLN